MLLHYCKVSLRYLARHKAYASINILGLTVSISCCLLIMIFIRSEFSYDAFHTNARSIYRVWQKEKTGGQEFVNTITPIPAGPAIKNTFPEVAASCRVYSFSAPVKKGQQSFMENMNMVDSTFFTMFSFRLLSGNAANPFPGPNTIILTPASAEKYFGKSDPIGKNLELQLGDNKILFAVAGIAAPAPEASSIRYEFLIPYSNAQWLFRPRMLQSWFNIFNETYVLLRNKTSPASLEKKFPVMMKQQLGENYGKEEFTMHLQAITDIHLNTALPAGNLPVSNPMYSYILGSIGLLLLLVACINFITLSVGRSASRALEVGVRKTLGAARTQLMRQFWSEALLMTLISFIAGLLLAALLLQPFNQLTERALNFPFDGPMIAYCAGLIVVVALVAGIYPAVILSGFKPVEVLKGKLRLGGSAAGLFRKGLIVGQFTASIIMIICTMVIGRQMQYLRHKNLGYNKEQVVIIETNQKRADGFALSKLYQEELKKYPVVSSASAAVFSFAEMPWATLGYADEKKQYHSFRYNEVDIDFRKTMQIQMKQGRWFDANNLSDTNNSIVVNEALVKEYGMENPVGKRFGIYSQTIVGVMEDFNYESLHSIVKPLLLSLHTDTIYKQSADVSFENSPQPRIAVRLQKGNMADNIALLQNTWKQLAPDRAFEYHFLDQSLAAAYKREQKSASLVMVAAGLSVFIACMGLFGLATLMVNRRTREIGIRKVMGAGNLELVRLLSSEFIVLVGVAALLSFPLAWFAMSRWLANFAYRVNLEWWVFGVAGTATIVLALLTVGYHALKAATANPVKSLRVD